MSKQLALDTIWLRPTPRFAHTEYSLEYHADYIQQKVGIPASESGALRRLYNFWKIGLLWNTNDGLYGDWLGRGGRHRHGTC